ncbi:MAG: PIN domain-containing protein [Chitinophagaceae bacterium]
MDKIVLDSYALITVFLDEPGADAVTKILLEGNAGNLELHITSYNMGEVYYMIWRKASKVQADVCWNAMLDLHLIVTEPSLDLTHAAATLKASYKLSYADAHAAALALHLKGTLLSNDKEFASLKNTKGFKLRSFANRTR